MLDLLQRLNAAHVCTLAWQFCWVTSVITHDRGVGGRKGGRMVEVPHLLPPKC